ncbi:glycolipid transfer protein [Russula earlei]|uniref:Glycolipid transfer protein n=1 Tax=Russula earlei TaxID=71964 RepID=A0ACC0U733_9AGAM|nr:glycolipid transfer protein [Russula earlei]
MAPQFETVKSFANVPITADGVETISFLEAADGLMDLFDLLGGPVFAFVQTDLRNNITGVRARYKASESVSETIENLVRAEALEGGVHGTACLVRLTRGLLFTCRALQNAQEDREAELKVCFKRAYDLVLRHHHSFVIRSVVSVAIHAVPRRNYFFTCIAQGGSPEKLDVELAKWLVALDAIIIRLSAFLIDGNYGRV